MPALPHVRCGSFIPIFAVLGLMFVIPHDPSVRISNVGSNGLVVGPSGPLWGGARGDLRWRPSSVAPEGETPLLRMRDGRKAMEPVMAHTWGTGWLSSMSEVQLDVRRLRALAALRLSIRLLHHQGATALNASVAGASTGHGLLSSNPSKAAEPPCKLTREIGEPYATSVEELRRLYGRRDTWWGGLDARQTRELYHSLLPTPLLNDGNITLAERARIAVAARRAARLYARERSMISVTLPVQLLDGFRQLCEHGTFQPDGLTEEQIWEKYAAIRDPHDDDQDFFRTILRKSCSTNRRVDDLLGLCSETTVMGVGINPGVGDELGRERGLMDSIQETICAGEDHGLVDGLQDLML